MERLDVAVAANVMLPPTEPDKLWFHVIVCEPLATVKVCGTSVAVL
jgi:hypothetical protein